MFCTVVNTATNQDQLTGVCRVIFAFDLGQAIDLEAVRRTVGGSARALPAGSGDQAPGATSPGGSAIAGAGGRSLKPDRPTPRYFEYRPEPVRTSEPVRSSRPGPIAGMELAEQVEATLFDFGAVCLSYHIPFQASIERLLELSVELYGRPDLQADARARVAGIAEALKDAISRPHVAEPVEDYAVFVLPPEQFGMDPAEFVSRHRAALARILRAELRPLSEQEQEDALSCRISYSAADLTLIDWNSAIVIHDDPEDVLSVLEFANVELLEMRHLDDQLDRALDEAYKLSQQRVGILEPLRAGHGSLERIALMQTDGALLFEGVNNALKLLGDQHLARVYRLAAHRLHLPDWDAAILRKLDTLESIYQKLADRRTNARMEALEWIIILLIAFEVVMSFVR